MIVGVNGLAGLGDSYGDEGPVEGTSLPSSELLWNSWGTAKAPTPAPFPPPAQRKRSFAQAPISPSLLPSGSSASSRELYPSDGFPPATMAKPVESIFGITLPSWLPRWAALTAGAVGAALLAKYAYGQYRRGGRRVVTNPKARKRARRARIVEGGDDTLVEKAKEFREKFHWGIKGRKVRRAKVSKPPRVATKLGELVNVTYKTKKRGEAAEHFVHEFGEEGGRRPTLAMDIENKKLHIVGGDYDVIADGIKD